MKNLTRYHLVLQVSLSAYAWLLLYGLASLLLGAGFADRAHVLWEGAVAILLLALVRVSRGGEPRRPGPGRVRIPGALLLAALFLLQYAAVQVFCLAGVQRPDYHASADIWYFLRTCATAPVVEEIGCRWIVYRGMRRGFGFWPSAAASAILFSVIHLEVS